MVKIREKQTEQLEKAASKGLKLGGWKKMTLSSKIAAVVLVLVALTAILAPLLAPYSPVEIFTARQAPGNGFIFGTDDKGRDILSRMLYGGRYSLITALAPPPWLWSAARSWAPLQRFRARPSPRRSCVSWTSSCPSRHRPRGRLRLHPGQLRAVDHLRHRLYVHSADCPYRTRQYRVRVRRGLCPRGHRFRRQGSVEF